MKVITSSPASAEENMQKDRKLLEKLEEPILHLYEWEREAITYGHFVKIEEYLEAEGLDVARRPTGGGIVFHTCDLAFSVLVPAGHEGYSVNTLENYEWVNSRVGEAIRMYAGFLPDLLPGDADGPRNFCMARPTIYDLVIDGKKVGGAAQRRTKRGYLHQGTIALRLPEERLLSRLKSGEVIEAMKRQTHPLCPDGSLEAARADLRHCLIKAFDGLLGNL